MADKKPKSVKPVMDVSRPGKSAPPPNSKSVIVSNRPILKDPMVVEDAPDNSLAKVSSKAKGRLLTAPLLETEEPDKSGASDSKPKAAKVIAPITKSEAKDETGPAKPKPPSGPEAEPATEESATEPATPPAKEAPTPTEAPTVAGTDAAGAKDTVAPKDKQAETETQDDKDAKHQAAIQKLADSKKYYLPINMVEKRRSKHFVIIGILLSLLLVVAWADIALDAGLIHIGGVKPVTHFFSN